MDVFGPIVLAPDEPHSWPSAVALDSFAFRIRKLYDKGGHGVRERDRPSEGRVDRDERCAGGRPHDVVVGHTDLHALDPAPARRLVHDTERRVWPLRRDPERPHPLLARASTPPVPRGVYGAPGGGPDPA